MEKKIKVILEQNEKRGANYGDKHVNNEGIIFDNSGRGYHIRVNNVKNNEKKH